MSFQLITVVTPVPNLPVIEAFVTAGAPGCCLHRRASTENGFGGVATGARQVVDADIVNRPTDTLQVEVAVTVACCRRS